MYKFKKENMKKYFLLFMMLFIATIVVFAQVQPDTTNVPVITGGSTILEFLKNNMWVLIFILYSFLEVWFGQTNLIKEGSLLAFIWNWIGRIIKKQVPSVKGKFMSEEQIKAVRR
jgi:hypothetical protein